MSGPSYNLANYSDEPSGPTCEECGFITDGRSPCIKCEIHRLPITPNRHSSSPASIEPQQPQKTDAGGKMPEFSPKDWRAMLEEDVDLGEFDKLVNRGSEIDAEGDSDDDMYIPHASSSAITDPSASTGANAMGGSSQGFIEKQREILAKRLGKPYTNLSRRVNNEVSRMLTQRRLDRVTCPDCKRTSGSNERCQTCSAVRSQDRISLKRRLEENPDLHGMREVKKRTPAPYNPVRGWEHLIQLKNTTVCDQHHDSYTKSDYISKDHAMNEKWGRKDFSSINAEEVVKLRQIENYYKNIDVLKDHEKERDKDRADGKDTSQLDAQIAECERIKNEAHERMMQRIRSTDFSLPQDSEQVAHQAE